MTAAKEIDKSFLSFFHNTWGRSLIRVAGKPREKGRKIAPQHDLIERNEINVTFFALHFIPRLDEYKFQTFCL